jgi:leucyl aminopeptidase
MKFNVFATALAASTAAALTIPARDTTLRTIKLSPTEIKQVTDEEKWELLKVIQIRSNTPCTVR